jgi:SAM-dependent methyltransferase
MWWFAACHANLLLLLRRFGPTGAVLDAGCGTGGLLAKLGRAAFGVDADAFACTRARAKSRRPVCAGSVNSLPFADKAFAAIVSADVLCHRGVDEGQALAQFRRCLRPGGVLVLNLPAYRWLLSRHDAAVYNVRRYTRRGVAAMLGAAGFRLCYASYWNAGLFPLMVATRKLLPGGDSDVRLYPAPVEALCRAVTAAERQVLRSGLRLPFGGSLVAVATREDADA